MTVSRTTPLEGKAPCQNQKRLKSAAQDLEGFFLEQMLTVMRSSKLASDPLDQGGASDIMHSMLDAELGKQIAHGHGLGLGDAIYRELAGKAWGKPVGHPVRGQGTPLPLGA